MNNIISFVKKHKISTILLGIGIILLGWWTVVNFMPHPLGDKMEYLGKKDYGNIFGFDYNPYSVYHYGTDMNEEEVAKYFNADLKHPIEDSGAYTDIYLTRDGEDFYLTYEASGDFKTSKKYTVSIIDKYYNIAKKYAEQ